MPYAEWWMVGLLVAALFNTWANVRFARSRRELARKLLEIHGMLVIMTERDPELRQALLARLGALPER